MLDNAHLIETRRILEVCDKLCEGYSTGRVPYCKSVSPCHMNFQLLQDSRNSSWHDGLTYSSTLPDFPLGLRILIYLTINEEGIHFLKRKHPC